MFGASWLSRIRRPFAQTLRPELDGVAHAGSEDAAIALDDQAIDVDLDVVLLVFVDDVLRKIENSPSIRTRTKPRWRSWRVLFGTPLFGRGRWGKESKGSGASRAAKDVIADLLRRLRTDGLAAAPAKGLGDPRA